MAFFHLILLFLCLVRMSYTVSPIDFEQGIGQDPDFCYFDRQLRGEEALSSLPRWFVHSSSPPDFGARSLDSTARGFNWFVDSMFSNPVPIELVAPMLNMLKEGRCTNPIVLCLPHDDVCALVQSAIPRRLADVHDGVGSASVPGFSLNFFFPRRGLGNVV